MRRMFTEKQVKDLAKKQVDAQVPEMIAQGIQADKDILSQIVVEYDEVEQFSTWTLPKNVLPLTMYIDNIGHVLYFDYDNQSIIDEPGSSWGSIDLNYNNQIILIFSGEKEVDFANDSMDYILSTSGYSAFNTYYIYNPITSGGTKLYRHFIDVDNSTASFVVISTRETPYNFNDFNITLGDEDGVLSIYAQEDQMSLVILEVYNGNFQYVNAIGNNDTMSFTDAIDTVTEL